MNSEQQSVLNCASRISSILKKRWFKANQEGAKDAAALLMAGALIMDELIDTARTEIDVL